MALRIEFGTSGKNAIVRGSERDTADFLMHVLELTTTDDGLVEEILFERAETHKMFFCMVELSKHPIGKNLVIAVQKAVSLRIVMHISALLSDPCSESLEAVEFLQGVLECVQDPHSVLGTHTLSKN